MIVQTRGIDFSFLEGRMIISSLFFYKLFAFYRCPCVYLHSPVCFRTDCFFSAGIGVFKKDYERCGNWSFRCFNHKKVSGNMKAGVVFALLTCRSAFFVKQLNNNKLKKLLAIISSVF